MDEYREETLKSHPWEQCRVRPKVRRSLLQRLRKNKARSHDPAVPEMEELDARRPGFVANSFELDKSED